MRLTDRCNVERYSSEGPYDEFADFEITASDVPCKVVPQAGNEVVEGTQQLSTHDHEVWVRGDVMITTEHRLTVATGRWSGTYEVKAVSVERSRAHWLRLECVKS